MSIFEKKRKLVQDGREKLIKREMLDNTKRKSYQYVSNKIPMPILNPADDSISSR